jgi:hypothetical protein
MKIVLRAPGVEFRRVLIHLVFYFAVACLMASLITAPGQVYLGKFYYIKDAGALLCFLILGAMSTARNDKLGMILPAVAVAMMAVFVPALWKDETPATALVIVWISKWAVAAQLGLLTYRMRLWKAVTVALAGLLGLICADGLIGLWEIHHQQYFFDISALEETAAGTAMVKQEHVGELLRVLSIHRSGTDFGNSMATGMILCAFLFMTWRRVWARVLLAPLFLLFAFDLFFSTVRSFLIGGLAGAMALIGYMLLPRGMGRFTTQATVALIGVCLFFSYFNIIPLVEFVSTHLLHDSAIGSVESSYMRLDTWDDVYRDITGTPVVALIGGPLAAALSLGAPPSNICDNIYLWMFYHTGIFGLLAFIVGVPLPLATRAGPRARALYFAAATQLLVTGIFTDSLFYFSSLVLFFALGLILAEMDATGLPAPMRFKFTTARRAPREEFSRR